MKDHRPTTLIIAYPAFGHVLPMLDLARCRAKSHDVTFILSSYFLDKLFSGGFISSNEPGIKYIPQNDGTHENLRLSEDKLLLLDESWRKFLKGNTEWSEIIVELFSIRSVAIARSSGYTGDIVLFSTQNVLSILDIVEDGQKIKQDFLRLAPRIPEVSHIN
jgi:UDP:flavonoid glycosyltransferase YjiC (YdhE family)